MRDREVLEHDAHRRRARASPTPAAGSAARRRSGRARRARRPPAAAAPRGPACGWSRSARPAAPRRAAGRTGTRRASSAARSSRWTCSARGQPSASTASSNACQRRVRDAAADLPDARPAVGDAGVHRRREPRRARPCARRRRGSPGARRGSACPGDSPAAIAAQSASMRVDRLRVDADGRPRRAARRRRPARRARRSRRSRSRRGRGSCRRARSRRTASPGRAARPGRRTSGRPCPETRMPTSTPLRAIAVRTGEPGTSAAQSSASLEKTIARLRKNWPLPAMKARDVGVLDAERLAGSAPVPCLGAVVRLVAERERAQRAGRCRSSGPRASSAVAQLGREHVAHPLQPLEHLRPVGAVAQDRAGALVERAPGDSCRSPRRRASQHRHAAGSRRRPSARRRRRRGWWQSGDLRRRRRARSASAGVPATPSSQSGGAERGAHRRAHAGRLDRRPGVRDAAGGVVRGDLGGGHDVDHQRARRASRATASAAVCSAAFMPGGR